MDQSKSRGNPKWKSMASLHFWYPQTLSWPGHLPLILGWTKTPGCDVEQWSGNGIKRLRAIFLRPSGFAFILAESWLLMPKWPKHCSGPCLACSSRSKCSPPHQVSCCNWTAASYETERVCCVTMWLKLSLPITLSFFPSPFLKKNWGSYASIAIML